MAVASHVVRTKAVSLTIMKNRIMTTANIKPFIIKSSNFFIAFIFKSIIQINPLLSSFPQILLRLPIYRKKNVRSFSNLCTMYAVMGKHPLYASTVIIRNSPFCLIIMSTNPLIQIRKQIPKGCSPMCPFLKPCL